MTNLSLFQGILGKDGVSTDPSDLKAYGKDWTKVYEPKPACILFPRTTVQVAAILKSCYEHGIRVVPSGGRTGLAAGAVAANGEAVLSLSKMNQIGEIDTLSHTVKVQAGAVTEAVHQACEVHGLTWPVDFASKGSSTIGGNISTNAGGVKVIHYGMTRNWILGLQVVLMDGTVLELNGALEKNNTGPDLKHLFIGSEGILGVVTEATLKLSRVAREPDVFMFGVEDMPAILRLFEETRRGPFTLMAYEMLTHNCLEETEIHLGCKSPFTEKHGCYVLVEIERPQSDNAKAVLDEWLASLFEKGLVQDGVLAQSPREMRDFWKIREGIGEALFTGSFVHKNDISVPVAALNRFVAEMYAMFQKFYGDFGLYVFGHIGDGNLHINTKKPDGLSKEQFLDRCHQADQDLFAIVSKYQGSVSAEHGIGLLKREDLHFSRTPEELQILKALKRIFDPKGLLNPGKVLE